MTMTKTQTPNATIQERGNGFCAVGDYVSDGVDVYRVLAFVGPIHTDAPGAPNYIHAVIEPADWDDLSDAEADDIICSCVVGPDEEDEMILADRAVQIDLSGQGHAWRTPTADELGADVRLEIEAEILDGGRDTCEDYVASNGLHYRWA
jgi:hypothetical protein